MPAQSRLDNHIQSTAQRLPATVDRILAGVRARVDELAPARPAAPAGATDARRVPRPADPVGAP